MPQLTRITRDPAVMGGKPCIRGMRAEDIAEALSYAAWRAEVVEVPLRQL